MRSIAFNSDAKKAGQRIDYREVNPERATIVYRFALPPELRDKSLYSSAEPIVPRSMAIAGSGAILGNAGQQSVHGRELPCRKGA
jgi:hypothetical protein